MPTIPGRVLPLVPAKLDLVGLNEVGRMAGVTRQRAFVLAAKPDFPRPVADLETGRLWRRSAVERWLESWIRRPGRPRPQKGGGKRG